MMGRGQGKGEGPKLHWKEKSCEEKVRLGGGKSVIKRGWIEKGSNQQKKRGGRTIAISSHARLSEKGLKRKDYWLISGKI